MSLNQLKFENFAHQAREFSILKGRMNMELAELVNPKHTVVITMEMQRGIVGDLSSFPELRDAAADSGVLSNGPVICNAAREAGVRVLHAIAVNRADHAGSKANCRMLAASEKINQSGSGLVENSEGAELVSSFGPEPEDIVVPRLHGLTPFTSTALDQIIRNLDTQTVVALGVSLNIGVIGLAMSAVDLGYQVVIPTDAVTGVPIEYGQRILQGSLSLLASLTSTEDLVRIWETYQT